MTPPPGPMLTLHDRQVSERPQGLARRLARASVGMLLVSCVASLLLSLVYPESTAMPHGLGAHGPGYLQHLGLTGLAALAQPGAG
ncbi:MAG: hypothetical protein U0325_09450 [Polyangiales bacterium]